MELLLTQQARQKLINHLNLMNIPDIDVILRTLERCGFTQIEESPRLGELILVCWEKLPKGYWRHQFRIS